MPYGFGIIGCGMIARFHARAIAQTKGARLIGCYSRSLESAQRLAAEAACEAYSRLDDLLSDPEIDVVTVATPSGEHLEPATAAARARKHVIVEKPLEIKLKRCDAIIRACEQNGVKLAAIFPSRFHDAARDLKRAVESGRFGRPVLANAIVKWYRSQAYYDSGAWRGTWKLDGGGALMNQAIHSVDLLAWLMGPIVEVQAQTATLAHERIEVEDTAVATLRFANGALGVIEASTAVYPGYLKRIEIHGSAGSAVLEEEDIVAWDFAEPMRADHAIRRRMKNRRSAGGGAADPAAINCEGHARQFADMLDAIRHDRPPAVDGIEGRRAVEIVLAIYKSAKTGRPLLLK